MKKKTRCKNRNFKIKFFWIFVGKISFCILQNFLSHVKLDDCKRYLNFSIENFLLSFKIKSLRIFNLPELLSRNPFKVIKKIYIEELCLRDFQNLKIYDVSPTPAVCARHKILFFFKFPRNSWGRCLPTDIRS